MESLHLAFPNSLPLVLALNVGKVFCPAFPISLHLVLALNVGRSFAFTISLHLV